ncbi:DUF1987 domain-containing protein [Crocinitomix algicola]|uniref:DUF1987 domain-containing protein n=1 Tax=Crocinitomix algicola TaxID=1740263 RepID=UPI0009F30778|nr:DUF1987 domain-containing protein [Crocinitomix algicola]
MMVKENLIYEGTRSTPQVELNPETGKFRIEGRSIPENAFEFYKPVMEWLIEYNKTPNVETHLEIYLEYINSGSLKQLFRIIYVLEDALEMGNESYVTWFYRKGDELMLQKGLEFQQFLDIPIQLKEI